MTVQDLMLRLQRMLDHGEISPHTYLAVPSTTDDRVYHHARKINTVRCCTKWHRLITPCPDATLDHAHHDFVALDF